jgi:DNA modification methylase
MMYVPFAVALKMGLHAIGIELNPAYAEMSRRRCAGEEQQTSLFAFGDLA